MENCNPKETTGSAEENGQNNVIDVPKEKELRSDVAPNKILTIPNIISFFRLVLIPVIIWAYVFKQNYTLSIILFAVSVVSDIVDGIIARKFNMTSEFGKLIDPVADKFTQGSLMICLTFTYWFLIFVIVAFVIREIVMIIFGTILKKRTAHYSSAKWYGKVNTVIVEGSVMFLLVFGRLFPVNVANVIALSLTCLSIFSITVSLILYVVYYLKLFKDHENKEVRATE